MLWTLASLFFCWLFIREFLRRRFARAGYDQPDTRPLDKTYLAIVGVLALALAWPPLHTWHFERRLTRIANQLADTRHARVHCNTVADTLIDPESMSIGHANFETGQIVIQHPWCGYLMDYLDHPARASRVELASLNMFTHESMHVRGERNEARTECQAVQRNYRAARLLGVPDSIARRNALDYYHGDYQERGKIGGFQAAYYSDECAPGKAMDEQLPDSTWAQNQSLSTPVSRMQTR
jgi:hypothetical protein